MELKKKEGGENRETLRDPWGWGGLVGSESRAHVWASGKAHKAVFRTTMWSDTKSATKK